LSSRRDANTAAFLAAQQRAQRKGVA